MPDKNRNIKHPNFARRKFYLEWLLGFRQTFAKRSKYSGSHRNEIGILGKPSARLLYVLIAQAHPARCGKQAETSMNMTSGRVLSRVYIQSNADRVMKDAERCSSRRLSTYVTPSR